MSLLFTPEEERVIPTFNDAVNEAMALHVYGRNGVPAGTNFAELDDVEFQRVVDGSVRQPLNPITVCREALGYESGATLQDIMAGLRTARRAVLQQYLDHGVDPRPAWKAISDIIGHTEAYITGYSRVLGALAQKFILHNPKYNALDRWIGKLWVPEEDGHDRTHQLVQYSTEDTDAEEFATDHIRHMQKGMHVPATEVVPTTIYLWGQEDSTTISYRNREKLEGPVFYVPVRKTGSQEAVHTRLYGIGSAALMRMWPDLTVVALEEEHNTFAMPGREGIRNFGSKALVAAIAGLLDPVSVLEAQRERVKRLKLTRDLFKSDPAKKAYDTLVDPDGPYGDDELKRRRVDMEKKRERAIERARKSGQLMPAIIDVTVTSDARGNLSFPISA